MKVFCVRNIYNFKKNKYYEVFVEFNDSYWIHDELYDEIKFRKFKSKYINDVTFDEYFLDVQKLRKEKIKKLNTI